MTDRGFVRQRFPTIVVRMLRRGDGVAAYVTNVAQFPDAFPTTARQSAVAVARLIEEAEAGK